MKTTKFTITCIDKPDKEFTCIEGEIEVIDGNVFIYGMYRDTDTYKYPLVKLNSNEGAILTFYDLI